MPLISRLATGHLTPEEIRLLLDCSQAHPRDGTLLRLLYCTGLRRVEAVEVRVADILWDDSALLVRSGKDDKDRLVLFDPTTLQRLRQYCQDLPGERRVFPHTGKWVHDTFLIYARRCGLMQKYADLGLRLSPHSLRHAFATHFYDAGLEFGTVAELLGHTLPQDTLTYLESARARLESAYEGCHPFGGGSPPPFSRVPPPLWGQTLGPGAQEELDREFATQPEAARPSGLPACPTRSEVHQLLQAARPQPQLYALFRQLYASGCRLEEALAGQKTLVDPETQALLPVTYDLTAPQVAEHFARCAHDTGLASRFAAMGRGLGLDCLRWCFAVHSLENGLDLVSLMALLGHRHHQSAYRFFRAGVGRFGRDYRKAWVALGRP